MPEAVLHKFTVNQGSSLNHNGAVKKGGDVIELSEGQALEFRSMLTPADDTASALFVGLEDLPEMANLRDHEKIQILEKRHQILTEQLDIVNKAMEAISKSNPKAAAAKSPERLPAGRTK
jgi:hypothetical protein